MLRKSAPTIIAAMLVLCCSNVAFGFDPMGQPKAGLSEGDGGWQVDERLGVHAAEPGPGVPEASPGARVVVEARGRECFQHPKDDAAGAERARHPAGEVLVLLLGGEGGVQKISR